ncbi:hypothetical protein F4780DRAFT_783518 [Xylariomycetidae sp. FL0641]|nr:hypothetical protein F4780DRAFT_783518 [Xylariomycetidae sp. FL0641]
MVPTFTFGQNLWDPSHRFQTSWLVLPYVLGGIRATMALYAFVTLLFNIGYECAHPAAGGCEAARSSFSYFTVLTYWGIAFYMLAAAVHTFSYARSASGAALLDRFPRALQHLHALYYTTVTTYPVLVTAVYWGVLYGPDWFPTPFAAWSNLSQHAMNTLFALAEVLLPRTRPAPWLHLPALILILALYLALAYVTRATQGFYTYDFLDPGVTGDLVAAYVFGIAVGIVVIFALVHRGVIGARRWLTEDKLHMDGKFAGAGRSSADDLDGVHHEMTTVTPAVKDGAMV